MGKKKTWTQEYRRSRNKIDVLNDFISCEMSYVIECIEGGRIGPMILPILAEVNHRFDSLGQSCEFEKGWKIKKGWFPYVLATTALNGRVGAIGFTRAMKELYEDMGWNFAYSQTPNVGKWDDVEEIWIATNGGENVLLDIVLEESEKYPSYSVWVDKDGRHWNVEESHNDKVLLTTSKKKMWFLPKKVNEMKRVK